MGFVSISTSIAERDLIMEQNHYFTKQFILGKDSEISRFLKNNDVTSFDTAT